MFCATMQRLCRALQEQKVGDCEQVAFLSSKIFEFAELGFVKGLPA